ncbi:MAG: tail fiber domain-containing protein [Candidatus Zixiibacteriota bacterium]|nr:MAG: tail fiber domain-containing protein [candidate division Zixibacteria bacterium]
MQRVGILFVALAVVLFASAAVADVPQTINYQGRLTDPSGDPVPDGEYELSFRIYNVAEGGLPVWGPESPKPITVTDGLFTWPLGWLLSFPAGFFDDTSRWLGITVESDPEIEPRTQLNSVPYAYHALRADNVGPWSTVDSSVYRANGCVGIGTATPRAMLDVAGPLRVLRNDDFSWPSDGEGMEIFYDPVERVGVIEVFDRPLGYRKMNFRHSYVGFHVDNPQYRVDVAGDVHASSFPTSSDVRFKKNIRKLDNVLEKLDQIRGVSFDWNAKYEELGRSTGHREIGVIAQEVEKAFPELVSTWADEDYRAVDYGRMTAVLIEAIKELKAENESLKQRIEKLEKQ